MRGSRYGSLVRVGENFTNENIVPVGRGGMGGGGGGSSPVVLQLRLPNSSCRREDITVGTLRRPLSPAPHQR